MNVKYLPVLVFVLGFVIAATALFMLSISDPRGEAGAGAFVFVFGLFSYLALMGWLGRLVAVEKKRDLGMILSFILGPIGVVVAALLRSDS